ncbi:MAG: hypothetical protein N2645_22095 [Clostridia bacterium]|nr:hypothetical protein [Clostridia bacterium]
MRKWLCSIVLVLLTALQLYDFPCYADGMLHKYDRDQNWRLVNEGIQVCAIDYHEGIQNMLLTVSFADEEISGQKAVWLFPVPSGPKSIQLDVQKGFPTFRGVDIENLAEENIQSMFSLMRSSQLYPVVGSLFSGTMSAPRSKERPIIHQSMEKMGIKTELVTASDLKIFEGYLVEKGLKLRDNAQSVLKDYMDKDYSFVVTWISDLEKYMEEMQNINERNLNSNIIGVNVKFPTEKIYYPLKPTSVYGELEVPTTIYVLGHVTPQLYDAIKSQSRVNYYRNRFYEDTFKQNQIDFFKDRTLDKNFPYTKIEINSPSNSFKDDLWIKPEAPFKIILAEHFNGSLKYILGVVIFLLCSVITSLLTGFIVFGKKTPSKLLIPIGVFNIFTILGVWISAYFLLKKYNTSIDSPNQEQVSYKPVPHIIKFTILYSVSFIAVTFLAQSVFIWLWPA